MTPKPKPTTDVLDDAGRVVCPDGSVLIPL
jgi:hypothetical protein